LRKGYEDPSLMDNRNLQDKSISGLLLYLAPLPAVFLAAVTIALHLFLPVHPESIRSFEPPLLLPILNTVLVFVLSGIVCYAAMRSYFLSGSPTVLLLGCGVLMFGTGALFAGWLSGISGPNANVTVFGLSALFAAILHAASSMFNLRQKPSEPDPSHRRSILAASYLAVFALMGMLAWAATAGALPPFVQGKNPTMARQVVLASSLALFAVAFFLILARFIRSKSQFLYWYSLALASLVLNMLSFLLARIPADPIIWAGRSARYIAGIYFVLAVVSATREARLRGIGIDQVIAELFSTSKIYWQDILDTVSDAIISCDGSGRILQWNQAAEMIFGYRQAEVIGKDLELVLPGARAPDLGAGADRAFKTGVMEVDLKRKDKTALSVEVSISRRTLSTGEIVTLVVRDVTERKRAERALQESERRWATTLASIGDAVIATDATGRITFMNGVAESLTGWTLTDAAQRPVTDVFKIVNEETRNEVDNPVAKVVEKGMVVGLANHTVLIRKDGTELPIDDSGAPIKDRGGKIVGAVLIFRDISERKKAEKEQQGLQEQLRQSQKMEALGTLSGGIAHDFNNILAAIIGFTELLAEHASKGSRDERHLARIMEAGLRGRDLVRQMLIFTSKTEQQKKPVRLSSIINEAMRLIRAATPATISISVNIQSESLILADPIQVQQVLTNLCTNATHAMREKGGVLVVELTDFIAEREDRQGMPPGRYAKLVVRDTGVGMPPEIIGRIFDPFFTTKGLASGTGLGLSVVHGIVRQSNGTITVESEPGKGSVFTVYFTTTEGEVMIAPVSHDAPLRGRERILFVDDEEALVEMAEAMLTDLGYQVTSRTSSTEALALVKENPSGFDVIITDHTMPGMTGLTLAQEVLTLRKDMPIILCTGYSETVSEEKAKNVGIAAFVMKPVVKKEMAETIRNVLGQKTTAI
jgi:PAS domain S-box-containing protein